MPVTTAKRPLVRRRLAEKMRGKHVAGVGWPKDKGMRRRLRHALYDMCGWWDWGHAVMALTGRDDGGTFSPPEPRSWYWFDGADGPVIAKSYEEKRAIDAQVEMDKALWAARWPEERRQAVRDESWEVHRGKGPLSTELHADRCPEPPYWHYFNVQDDGHTLIAGNVYGERGGVNYGLSLRWSKVLVRYVVVEWWIKANWLGLRPWLYFKGLHRAVDMRIPFRCNARPPKDKGGYSHWACSNRKRHDGEHRVRNYTWNDGEGATYAPIR